MPPAREEVSALRYVRSRPGPAQASWLDVFRALRHRTLNRLQVAHGWAQLGEEEAARSALEEYLLEEQRLSALLASATRRDQRTLLTLLARCERAGRPVRLTGAVRTYGRAEAAAGVTALQRIVAGNGREAVEIALQSEGVRVQVIEGGSQGVR
jgi:hypothetical protein